MRRTFCDGHNCIVGQRGVFIPAALHRIVRQLGIHREIEEVIGAGPTMLTGLGLVALSILLACGRPQRQRAGARRPCLCLAIILLAC